MNLTTILEMGLIVTVLMAISIGTLLIFQLNRQMTTLNTKVNGHTYILKTTTGILKDLQSELVIRDTPPALETPDSPPKKEIPSIDTWAEKEPVEETEPVEEEDLDEETEQVEETKQGEETEPVEETEQGEEEDLEEEDSAPEPDLAETVLSTILPVHSMYDLSVEDIGMELKEMGNDEASDTSSLYEEEDSEDDEGESPPSPAALLLRDFTGNHSALHDDLVVETNDLFIHVGNILPEEVPVKYNSGNNGFIYEVLGNNVRFDTIPVQYGLEKEVYVRVEELPEDEVPEQKVLEQKVSEQKVLEDEVLNQEVSEDEVPDQNVSEDDVPDQNVSEDDVPEQNVSEDDVPEQNVSEDEVLEQKVLEDEVPDQEVSEQEVSVEVKKEYIDIVEEDDDGVSQCSATHSKNKYSMFPVAILRNIAQEKMPDIDFSRMKKKTVVQHLMAHDEN